MDCRSSIALIICFFELLGVLLQGKVIKQIKEEIEKIYRKSE